MAIIQQGDEALAVKSTRFLGIDAAGAAAGDSWSTMATDLSQDDTDLTSLTGGARGDDDTRFESSHRTVRIRFQYNSGAQGWLYHQYANGTSPTTTNREAVEMSLGTMIVYYATDGSGTTGSIFQINLSGSTPVNASNGDVLLFCWVTRANPGAAGSSDAVQHFFYFHNETTGDLHQVQNTTTYALTRGGTTRTEWGTQDGASSYDYDVYLIAWDDEVMPFALIRELHIGAAAIGASDVSEYRQVPSAERATWDVGDGDSYYGPAMLHAAHHQRNIARRMFSPLVNELYAAPFRIDTDTGDFQWVDAPEQWYQIPGTDYYAHIGWLRWRPVPDLANRLWSRLYVQTTVASGSAVPVSFRVYSFDNLPGRHDAQFFTQETLTTDHSGAGEWVCEDLMPIARTNRRMTYLTPALAIDPEAASSNDANARVYVKGWGVFPRYVVAGQGGLPLGGFDP